MFDVYALFAAGLALLWFGGEALVAGGAGLAHRLGVQPLVIGLVVVSAATAGPELAVGLSAVAAGRPDLLTGNVVGANLANLLLILGLAAIARPLPSAPAVVFRDGLVMIAASLVLVRLVQIGVVTTLTAGLLVGALVAFMAGAALLEWHRPSAFCVFRTRARGHSGLARLHAGIHMLLVGLGIGLLSIGAKLTVGGASPAVRRFGWPDYVLGLTVLAIGTSLPELVTTVVATLRRRGEIAVGNLVGSNIFNVFGVMGIAGLSQPFAVSPALAMDAWVMLAAAVLVLPLLITGWRLSRMEGALLLGGYSGWLAYLAGTLDLVAWPFAG